MNIYSISRSKLSLLAFVLLLVNGLHHAAFSQNPDHLLWLRTMNGKKSVGYLTNLDENSLSLRSEDVKLQKSEATYAIADIKTIRYRKSNAVIRGVAAGALTGVVCAMLLGSRDAIKHPEPDILSTSDVMIIYGIITVPSGAVAGAMIGSNKKRIDINGSKSKYAEQREKLEQLKAQR